VFSTAAEKEVVRLNKGVNFHLFVLVLFIVSFYFASSRFKQTGSFFVRKLDGIAKIEEAIGRATELGRPVHWTYGTGVFDAQYFAGFSLLEYTAGLCAKYGTRIIVSLQLPEVQPMTEEVVRKAFTEAGRAEAYRPEDIRFWGGSHNPAMIGLIAREEVAGNFMIGSLFYESILGIEAAARNNAIQVAGTANTHQLPFIAAGCDAIFIGAEMFAAAAQLNPTPTRVGSTMAEEWIKDLLVVLMIIGAIMATMGNTSLGTFMKS
jgi:hypothetical protein